MKRSIVLMVMAAMAALLLGGSIAMAQQTQQVPQGYPGYIEVSSRIGSFPLYAETLLGGKIPNTPVVIGILSTNVDEIPMTGVWAALRWPQVSIEATNAWSYPWEPYPYLPEATFYKAKGSVFLLPTSTGFSCSPYLGLKYSYLTENWGDYYLEGYGLFGGLSVRYSASGITLQGWFEQGIETFCHSWSQVTITLGGSISISF